MSADLSVAANGKGSRSPDAEDDDEELASVSLTPRKSRTAAIANGWDSPAASSRGDADEDSADDEPRPRVRPMREARKNAKQLVFTKRRPKAKPDDSEDEEPADDGDLPANFVRCKTCVKPLIERVWFNAAYFDFCTKWVLHFILSVVLTHPQMPSPRAHLRTQLACTKINRPSTPSTRSSLPQELQRPESDQTRPSYAGEEATQEKGWRHAPRGRGRLGCPPQCPAFHQGGASRR